MTHTSVLSELMSAAFEVLLLHPGCSFSEWQRILILQYRTEVTDVFGADPIKLRSALDALWSTPYRDRFSTLTYPFSTWAECFSTEASVQLYYDLSSLLNASNSSVSRQ